MLITSIRLDRQGLFRLEGRTEFSLARRAPLTSPHMVSIRVVSSAIELIPYIGVRKYSCWLNYFLNLSAIILKSKQECLHVLILLVMRVPR